VPAEASEPSAPGGGQLEGVACVTGVVDASLAPSRVVFALQHPGRNNVYCSSAPCVSTLLSQGWRLSDPAQLSALVRALATGRAPSTHSPSDHFE
jgi:hypothetical protein